MTGGHVIAEDRRDTLHSAWPPFQDGLVRISSGTAEGHRSARSPPSTGSARTGLRPSPDCTSHALREIANAAACGGSCSPMTADDLRVCVAGQKDSVFQEGSQLHFTACANTNMHLLDVQAFQLES